MIQRTVSLAAWTAQRRCLYTLTKQEMTGLKTWSDKAKTRPPDRYKVFPDPTGLSWLMNALPIYSQQNVRHPRPSEVLHLPLGFTLVLPDSAFDNVPLERLGPDGTSPLHSNSIPEPFTRRMWAGGKMSFSPGFVTQLRGGVAGTKEFVKVEHKGFENGDPKVFLTRKYTWDAWLNDIGSNFPALVEERTHVYLTPEHKRRLHIVEDLPEPEFHLKFTPTTPLLFRFSAISRNDHKIHYDLEYCRTVEGLPGPVMHGPLTALLLLEFLQYHKPKGTWISEFEYKATNPLVVNEPITFHGAFTDESKMEATVWAKGHGEGIGMVARGKMVSDGSRSV